MSTQPSTDKNASLQTRTGREEYQVSDLDEVVWWRTENGIIAVGYMDVVSGLMSENDLELVGQNDQGLFMKI